MKQTFGDGSVLLTGDDFSRAMEAVVNKRGAHDRGCSFCIYEQTEDCDGCALQDRDLSCSCHINPPCAKCVNSKFDVSPYLLNYEHIKQGRRRWECFRGDKKSFEKLTEIENAGLGVTAETLMTGEIAFYIGNGMEDYTCDICLKVKFRQELPKAIVRFDLENREALNE